MGKPYTIVIIFWAICLTACASCGVAPASQPSSTYTPDDQVPASTSVFGVTASTSSFISGVATAAPTVPAPACCHGRPRTRSHIQALPPFSSAQRDIATRSRRTAYRFPAATESTQSNCRTWSTSAWDGHARPCPLCSTIFHKSMARAITTLQTSIRHNVRFSVITLRRLSPSKPVPCNTIPLRGEFRRP